jgi:hypothetical protein
MKPIQLKKRHARRMLRVKLTSRTDFPRDLGAVHAGDWVVAWRGSSCGSKKAKKTTSHRNSYTNNRFLVQHYCKLPHVRNQATSCCGLVDLLQSFIKWTDLTTDPCPRIFAMLRMAFTRPCPNSSLIQTISFIDVKHGR